MAKPPTTPAPSAPEQHLIGQNIITKVDGNILTITVDLSQTHGPSTSGKTLIVASSKGNVQIPDAPDVMMGVNLYRYAEKKTGAATK